MRRTKSVTVQAVDLSGFRGVAGCVADTESWIGSVGERETVFDEMRDDPRVESLVKNRKDKVLQMSGSFTETKNRAVNEACENILSFNVFYALNNILLNAVPYGLAACEVLWELKGGWYVPSGFVPIPRTALSFPSFADSGFFDPVLTAQNIVLDDRKKFIVHRNSDGNLSQWGRPALQSAYGFWKFKQFGVRFWSMAAEIVGAPTILALFDVKGEADARKRARELTDMMANWKSGSNGALGNVRDVKVISSQINDFKTIIDTCDTEIAYALTCQSLATNEGQYGTRAQGVLHENTYDETIKGDAYLLQKTDQQLVDAFVELNFPGEAAPQYDIDSTDFAGWEIVRDAIDRGIPVSLKALYTKTHLPKPLDDNDSFVKQQQTFGFSDAGKESFFQSRL